MPVRIIINAKHVVKDDALNKIMDIYGDALKSASICSASALAAASAEVSRQGIWARYVLAPYEAFTGHLAGAKEIILPELALELDPPAEALFIAYRSFLNSLLLAQDIKPEQTEKIVVSSSFTLVWELLLRLTAISLCDRLDYQNDGDNLRIAMDSFVGRIFREEILAISHWYSSKSELSEFWLEFAAQYQNWNELIGHMITCVKTLRSNQDAVTSTLTALNKTKNVIRAHLLVFLKDKETKGILSDTWVYDTWSDQEYILLDKKSFPNNDEKTVAMLAAINNLLTPAKKPHPNKEHIKNLYLLLNRTEIFYKIMSQIDLWMTSAGWIPILSGVINFASLSEVLSAYSDDCTRTLKESYAKNHDILHKPLAQDYLKFQAIASSSLQHLMMESGTKLYQLMDKMRLNAISDMIYNIGISLIDLQTKLGEGSKFIYASLETVKEQSYSHKFLHPSSDTFHSTQMKTISTFMNFSLDNQASSSHSQPSSSFSQEGESDIRSSDTAPTHSSSSVILFQAQSVTDDSSHDKSPSVDPPPHQP